MKLRSCGSLKLTIDTEMRFQLTRSELFEMHLFDEDAREEEALCGRKTAGTERRSVMGYLEDRLFGNRVGTVCQDCKDRIASFAGKMIDELEANKCVEQADEYRLLAGTLARETGPDDNWG